MYTNDWLAEGIVEGCETEVMTMQNIQIPIYGLMILLSLVVNIFVVILLSNKYDFTKIEIMCLILYEGIGIILGGKILTFIQNYQEYNGEFDLIGTGLTSYGGAIGALLFLLVFSVQFQKSFQKMLFIFLPPIPLMYGIGKIGCSFAGCCHGIEYTGLGSVAHRHTNDIISNTRLFPVQLVETIVFLGIFICMIYVHWRNRFDMKMVGISFILCGISKFLLDFLRMSHIGQIISSNQWISLVFAFVGIFMVIKESRRSIVENPWKEE